MAYLHFTRENEVWSFLGIKSGVSHRQATIEEWIKWKRPPEGGRLASIGEIHGFKVVPQRFDDYRFIWMSQFEEQVALAITDQLHGRPPSADVEAEIRRIHQYQRTRHANKMTFTPVD